MSCECVSKGLGDRFFANIRIIAGSRKRGVVNLNSFGKYLVALISLMFREDCDCAGGWVF